MAMNGKHDNVTLAEASDVDAAEAVQDPQNLQKCPSDCWANAEAACRQAVLMTKATTSDYFSVYICLYTVVVIISAAF